jgi:DNA-binding CsgD family transcriptional regulator
VSAEALSALLLDLYRLARESPLVDFQRRVLERLNETVSFDGAWWGMARMDRQLHSSFPFHMPAHFVDYWSGMREHDVFAEFVMARPGVTLNFHAATSASNPTFDAFLEEFGIRQTLCTLLVNPTLNLITFLSLYRKRDAPVFTEEQRRLKELVMPHLWAAWTSNWIAQLAQARAHSVSSSAALAVADQRGVLHAAEPRFAELIHLEWPEWSGPELPDTFGRALRADGVALGTRTVLQLIPVHGLYLVELRERSPLEQLTARELHIAHQFGRGGSYKEIAAVLRVAPATVRAHLRAIYSKLHVSDKGELANLLSQHSEPRAPAPDK